MADNVINKLDTIIERHQQDDATPTGDTDGDVSNTSYLAASALSATSVASNEGATGGRVKKVRKGQINVLAKMLAALRR